MFTYQQIKDLYYAELALGIIKRQSLDQYIKDEGWIQVYDNELNYLGWSK